MYSQWTLCGVNYSCDYVEINKKSDFVTRTLLKHIDKIIQFRLCTGVLTKYFNATAFYSINI